MATMLVHLLLCAFLNAIRSTGIMRRFRIPARSNLINVQRRAVFSKSESSEISPTQIKRAKEKEAARAHSRVYSRHDRWNRQNIKELHALFAANFKNGALILDDKIQEKLPIQFVLKEIKFWSNLNQIRIIALFLNRNRLFGVMPFDQLPPFLEMLSMDDNCLFGPIERLPPYLRYLSLMNNCFYDVFDWKQMPRDLRVLEINGNDIVQTVNLKYIPDALRHLTMDDIMFLTCTMDDTAPVMTQAWDLTDLKTSDGDIVGIERDPIAEQLHIAAFLDNK